MTLVADILDDIRLHGWEAASRYTRQFDGVDRAVTDMLWNPMAEPRAIPDPIAREAIDFAMDQIRRFHVATRPQDVTVNQAAGLTLSERFLPLKRVGLYVPNGDYPLISSLLMTAIPARVAGVEDLVVAIPPRGDVRHHPLWLYALQTLAITEAISLGGAQAIGILGYGADHLPPVDLIAGPGNRYVAEAKQELQRRQVTGIDLTAGPSEVLIIADDPAYAEVAAMDLLAQAEHAADTRAFLVTWNPACLTAVKRRLAEEAKPQTLGAIELQLVTNQDEAVHAANRIAPEHLGLMGAAAEALLPRIRTAGAVFVGAMAGQALGDYVAGPSHVLPTGGTGRFLSGLSTRTFMRRMSVIDARADMPERYLQAGQVLAGLEGLTFHQKSLSARQALGGQP
ncbi:MAG: histidinol dehydrogenase [Thermaerobacter sp.]|nr:histidinol dehydrogenase [Thermaerobacter sp.]